MADPVNARACAGLAVLAAALAAVAACGTGAGTGGGLRAPALNPVPVTSAQLRSALLTRFGHARTLPSPASGHNGPPLSIVLAPTPANDRAARENGEADPPVSDPRCRLWTAGLWSEAVHTPGLGTSSRAAITSLYGLYYIPKPHSADVPLVSVSEIILATPAPAAAAKLTGGTMPSQCRRARVYAQPAAGLPQRWMATGGQLLKVALLGQQTHALRGIEQIGPRESRTIWTEWFRLKNYIVAVGMAGGRGVRFPSALRQLAQAACAKARAALF
jgi:hypothetical protein